MSERRALEYNFLQKMRQAFAGSEYSIFESNTYEERKLPCIVVVAGESQPLVDHPSAQDNFKTELNILIISSSDEESPEEHMRVCDRVRSVVMNNADRKNTNVKYLYIYDIYYQNVADAREERRFATSMNFEVHYNYNSNPSVSQ